MQYKKAPKFSGRDLTLEVGRGQVKILDNVVYADDRLDRYVSLGFLVRVKAGSRSGPVVATSVPSSAVAAPAAAVPDVSRKPSGVTKSPAHKVKSGLKTSTKVEEELPVATAPENVAETTVSEVVHEIAAAAEETIVVPAVVAEGTGDLVSAPVMTEQPADGASVDSSTPAPDAVSATAPTDPAPVSSDLVSAPVTTEQPQSSSGESTRRASTRRKPADKSGE